MLTHFELLLLLLLSSYFACHVPPSAQAVLHTAPFITESGHLDQSAHFLLCAGVRSETVFQPHS